MRRKNIFIALIIAVCVLYGTRESQCAQERPMRIVSLAPATTEILFALGLDKEVVGVSSFCNYPPAAREKEKVGTFSRPNIEKIVSLRPDIVMCTGLEQAPAVRVLRQLAIPVYVSDPSSVEELYDSIEAIGLLTHKELRAQALIFTMREAFARVHAEVSGIPVDKRPKVFVEFWNDPLMTAGKGSFVDDLIARAGGANIAYDAPRPYSLFSPETVLQRDPDCIIMTYMDSTAPANTLRKRIGWAGIAAVKNRRVYNDIDPDTFLRPGPRVVEGVRALERRLYPSS
jgi:iron complex transport system substrate-binding protein